jgi:hypothetical protein
MSYLRMGSDSGLVDPDVIDLTNDPELLGGAAALSKKTSTSKAADLFAAAKSVVTGSTGGAPKTASPSAPRRAPVIKKNVTIGQSTGTAPSTGMRRGYLDTTAATAVRSAGAPAINKTKWALIVGGALVVGGIAFYAMRKRG